MRELLGGMVGVWVWVLEHLRKWWINVGIGDGAADYGDMFSRLELLVASYDQCVILCSGTAKLSSEFNVGIHINQAAWDPL